MRHDVNKSSGTTVILEKLNALRSSWLGIYGHSRFCNTDTEDIVGLHESIRRLNGLYARATMSFAPDEPYIPVIIEDA